MKRLVTLCCAISFSCAAFSAPAKPTLPAPAKFEPVKAFQEIVVTSSEPKEWTRVYLNSRLHKWAKQYYVIGEVKYDVKKTDSLVTPILGLVYFPLAIKQSELFESQLEAEESTGISSSNPGLRYRVTGTYHADDAAWHLTEFQYEDANPPIVGVRNTKFTATGDSLRTEKNSALGNALQKWIR